MKTAVYAVVLAALALAGCGSPADVEAEPSPSALNVTTGTHRASGSYTCRLGTNGTATFSVATYLYLAGTSVPHRWGLHLSADRNALGVTLDIRDSSPLEADDNGAVVYSVPQDTIYVHRLTASSRTLEYTHDMSAPPYSIQVLPASAGHPLGQLAISMYPQGHSDPLKGECAEPVGMTLQIEP